MRGALAVLLLAVIWLGASSALWVRERDQAAPNDPAGAIAAFESSHRTAEIAIDKLYAGRLELLDPRLALPTWHQHAHDEAVRVHTANSTCPPSVTVAIADPVLAKAYEWHRRTCAGERFDAAVGEAPYLHPSGRSYAALALGAGGRPNGWITEHAREFHVAELPALDPKLLPAEQRALARLSFPTWEALGRGDLVALAPDALVVAEHDPLGLSKLRVYSLAEWNAFARRVGLALTPRQPHAICRSPASPELCWTSLSTVDRHRIALIGSTVLSSLIAIGSAIAVFVLWVRERNRLAKDRIEVLRILTHELRTPATSLRIDIEPLRAVYDELPAASQEPFLRLSDGVERLHRVIHRSARYLALFEAPNAPRDRRVLLDDHPSIAELLAELAEEWPEDAVVTLVGESADRSIRTDSDWLGLVLRNLVENAVRHGRPPVVVTWSIAVGELVLRVADAGTTASFSLREAARGGGVMLRRKGSSGLGLGLAIMTRGVQLLGGRLSHEPTPTVFELRLPLSGPT